MSRKQKHSRIRWLWIKVELWVLFPLVYEFFFWVSVRLMPYNPYMVWTLYMLWAIRIALWAMGIYGLMKMIYRFVRWAAG
jgi:hypothetical protein